MDANNFLEFFKTGRFVAARKWDDLDRLWEAVQKNNNEGWYVYAVGEEPPTQIADIEKLDAFIAEVDALLRKEHDEDYCGIVYADDHKNPSLVKIFDPNNLGVVCGFSDNPPLPGWVLSTLQPVDLPDAFLPPGSRKRWWQKIFS
ncbi:MAG TPA: hypothetical protein EYH06_11000 [Chromatiales bacterium]|nr:hypothetical protein [Thiotrichales bacterium]HIP69091.1 hypothetical protein [Chromatiales bacterium]